MLVTIIYNTDYSNEATNLKTDILNEWSECKINKLGITNTINNAKYQIQFNGSIIYTGTRPGDNTTIINLIKERL